MPRNSYVAHGSGWADIGYNFLVGEDGNAYEGRGWDRVGAHSPNYNSVAYGTCVMGTYTSRNPNAVAMQVTQQLISCGISLVGTWTSIWAVIITYSIVNEFMFSKLHNSSVGSLLFMRKALKSRYEILIQFPYTDI